MGVCHSDESKAANKTTAKMWVSSGGISPARNYSELAEQIVRFNKMAVKLPPEQWFYVARIEPSTDLTEKTPRWRSHVRIFVDRIEVAPAGSAAGTSSEHASHHPENSRVLSFRQWTWAYGRIASVSDVQLPPQPQPHSPTSEVS